MSRRGGQQAAGGRPEKAPGVSPILAVALLGPPASQLSFISPLSWSWYPQKATIPFLACRQRDIPKRNKDQSLFIVGALSWQSFEVSGIQWSWFLKRISRPAQNWHLLRVHPIFCQPYMCLVSCLVFLCCAILVEMIHHMLVCFNSFGLNVCYKVYQPWPACCLVMS